MDGRECHESMEDRNRPVGRGSGWPPVLNHYAGSRKAHPKGDGGWMVDVRSTLVAGNPHGTASWLAAESRTLTGRSYRGTENSWTPREGG